MILLNLATLGALYATASAAGCVYSHKKGVSLLAAITICVVLGPFFWLLFLSIGVQPILAAISPFLAPALLGGYAMTRSAETTNR